MLIDSVREKTNRIDARMLALMGQAFALEPQEAVPKIHMISRSCTPVVD